MNKVEPIKNEPTSRRNFLNNATKWIAGSAGLAFLINLFPFKSAKAASKNSALQATEPFLGEITIVGFNFAPVGWALCNGQLLPIAQNQALYALLGTTYGGDGQQTFALPNLSGRVPIHQGTGPGLTSKTIGEVGGTENVTLLTSQIPAHTHSLPVNSDIGNSDNPTNNYAAANSEGIKHYSNTASTVGGNLGVTGSSLPHDNMQPYLTVNYIIALQGVFPSRS